jgi:hypothetical protein
LQTWWVVMYFLSSLQKKYVDLVEERHHQTSWVTDEYAAAIKLYGQGRIRVYSVWKDATIRPSKLMLRFNVIDLRREPDNFNTLDSHFPEYSGPSIAPSARNKLLAFVRQCVILCCTTTSQPKHFLSSTVLLLPEIIFPG